MILFPCLKSGNLRRQAVISLIQKPGKDARDLKSWRPISLLNVDVKLLSKVLADRQTLDSQLNENRQVVSLL